MTYREAAERVALTFAEAALAVVVAAQTSFVDLAVWKAAAVAGGAAALSALLNTVRVKRSQF